MNVRSSLFTSTKRRAMKTFKRIFCSISITTIFFSLNPFFFEGRARGETHFIESLSLVRFYGEVKARDFLLKDLNGNEVHLASHQGKVIFLNFWATWCVACLVEMPSMEKLFQKFNEKDFVILAVDIQEDLEQVIKFKEKFKLSFPILLDTEGVVASYYGVNALPATYLIDREGYLYAAALGARNWASENAFLLIKHLIDK